MSGGKAAVDSRIDEKLAIEGGSSVRTKPLPPESPCANYYGGKQEVSDYFCIPKQPDCFPFKHSYFQNLSE
jgi:hypothetical protein